MKRSGGGVIKWILENLATKDKYIGKAVRYKQHYLYHWSNPFPLTFSENKLRSMTKQDFTILSIIMTYIPSCLSIFIHTNVHIYYIYIIRQEKGHRTLTDTWVSKAVHYNDVICQKGNHMRIYSPLNLWDSYLTCETGFYFHIFIPASLMN